MILEFPNYADNTFVDKIQQNVKPFLSYVKKETAYNRDGLTLKITDEKELEDLDKEVSVFFSTLSNEVVKQRYKPSFNSGDTGYEYHLYRPGEMCHYHADSEICTKSSLIRYATVILFLTDNDDGGLVFPAQNVEVKPEKGKVVVFPPSGVFGHYSKPSVKDREILMTWFVYSDIKVVNAT